MILVIRNHEFPYFGLFVTDVDETSRIRLKKKLKMVELLRSSYTKINERGLDDNEDDIS